MRHSFLTRIDAVVYYKNQKLCRSCLDIARILMKTYLFSVLIFLLLTAVENRLVNRNAKCGWRREQFNTVSSGHRIINGTRAEEYQFPWLARVKGPGCTGSIVSRKYILTASHCVHGKKPRKIRIYVGAVNYKSKKAVRVRVKRVIPHEHYQEYPDDTLSNDIALIKLAKSLDFDDAIQPICLSRKTYAVDQQTVVLVGWGDLVPDKEMNTFLSSTRDSTKYLHYGSGKVVNHDQCQRSFTHYNSTQEVCIQGTNSTDTWYGDSGGPVLMRIPDGPNKGSWAEVGITSYGSEPFRPAVYANPSHFCDWIEKNTKASVKCLD